MPPTGYTAAVQDGTVTDFKEFALTCARAMGACIMQRDDDLDEKPKLVEPSDYYDKALRDAENKLRALVKTSSTVLRKKLLLEAKNRIESSKKTIREQDEQKKRYDKMLVKVYNYTPPSPDHKNFKQFMIEQLKDSIKFDCGGDYYEENLEREIKEYDSLVNSDLAFLQQKKKELAKSFLRDIEYYTKKRDEEIKRTNERNRWITQLYNSLQ